MFRLSHLIFFLTCVVSSAKCQNFIPGNTYFGADNFIEYMTGNTPFIISVPHGGSIEPPNIPDRNCTNCEYLKDSYTQELARIIQASFFQKTGCYPHVIINLLHRKKLDMNREIIAATDSNSNLDIYWYDYHRFVDSAKARISQDHQKGLFLDIHGHGHPIQRIELGYLLTASELQQTDSAVNTQNYIGYSAIKNLAVTNVQNISHAQLLRGTQSFGTMLTDRGFPGVPSFQDPFPQVGDPYFNGGYNTFRHGSNQGGTIDAIQLELYSAIRFDSVLRKSFADSMVDVISGFLDAHYFPGYKSFPCSFPVGTVNLDIQADGMVFPNPASEFIFIRPGIISEKCRLFDLSGKCVLQNVSGSGAISLSGLKPGLYFLEMVEKEGKRHLEKVVKY